ncbi:MAG: hypothetical protein KDA25_09750 [Phycisphaerales bacterium]|nr:hypothetical protein [Phycisphaerales bacterium]
MGVRMMLVGVGVVVGALFASAPAAAPGDDAWASTFAVDRADLGPSGRNPYFVLVPGHRVRLVDAADEVEVIITVLDATEIVDGVTTRVVEERETAHGSLVEVSRNFFAVDRRTNDVYYFGEDVDLYTDGAITGHDGAWRSGVDGARFGLLMPAGPRVGQKHYQEIAPDVAMDRAEVVDLAATLETPLHPFTYVVHVRETSPLERGASLKWYAPGIGLIGDGGARVAEVTVAP